MKKCNVKRCSHEQSIPVYCINFAMEFLRIPVSKRYQF